MTYSTVADIKDPIIYPLSRVADHEEAKGYIDRIFAKNNITEVNVRCPIVKELSVAFACYKRAFYESKAANDSFYKIYLDYERQVKNITIKLLSEVIRKESPAPKPPENRHFGDEISPDLTHVLGYHEDDIMDEYKKEYGEDLFKHIDAYLRASITESELADKINLHLECAAELVAEGHVPEGTHHEDGEY